MKGSGTEHKKRYKGGPTCKKVFLNNYIFKSQMFFNGKEQRGAERSGSERCGAEQNAKRGPTCIKVPLNNYIFHFEMFSMERSEGERKRTQKEIQGRTNMQKGVSQ